MSNMGNLEKLGILVIVILVVVVGVVAITPNDTLFPEETTTGEALPPEPLDTTPPAVGTLQADPWPGSPGSDTGSAGRAPAATDPLAPATPPVAVAPQPVAQFRPYTVRSGDNLYGISKRELGSTTRIQEILAANPGIVPSKLKPGQVIQLPSGAAGATAPTATGPAPGVETAPTAPAAPERTYVVQSGDTLSSIAAAELGAANKWREILRANESVLHGSSDIQVGMKLRIPGAASASGGGTASAPAAGEQPTGGATYVVKAGDTLSAIARRELGSESLWKQIRDANDDVLHGSERLTPGMTLRIPAAR